MNTMKWLVKREFWEHKGGFFWAPAIVGAIMVFFLAATVLTVAVTGLRHHGCEIDNGHTICVSQSMTPDERDTFAHGLAAGHMAIAAPLYVVLGFVVFFFCLGSLFDDRKDRSVLFWKSLPISDHETVLSKVAMALLVAPLITIVAGTVVSIASLLVICVAAAVMGVNLFGIFGSADLYLSPFEVVGMLPIAALWALPTIGWLMMVSAWARTKPFLWAVGVPVFAGVLLTWFNAIFGFGWRIGWFWQHIVGRGLLSAFPGSWFAHHPASGMGETVIHVENGMTVHENGAHMGALMTQSWTLLATADLWIGVAIGAAMIYAAIRLRRWRDEG